MKADDLKKSLKLHVSRTEWTEKDTWSVLNRVRKEKARSGNYRIYTRVLAVAAAFVLLFVGVLAGTGHLGLSGRPDHIQNTLQPIPLAQRKVTPDTLLYYIPEIGEFYHMFPNCPAVSIQHKPMQAHFTWAEVNDEPYRDLRPCSACGSPERTLVPAETVAPVTEVPVPEATAADSKTDQFSNKPIRVGVELDKSRFRTGDTANIVITITNTTDGELPDSVILLDPKGRKLDEYTLAAGEEKQWSGSLTPTLEQLEAGKVTYAVRYSIYDGAPDENGNPKLQPHKINFSKRIIWDQSEVPADTRKLYEYSLNDDGTVTITKANDYSPDTYIPGELDGYKVTAIGKDTFEECAELESVTVPEGVTSIEGNAFHSCGRLAEVTLPDSLTSLGEDVFFDCPKLKTINISQAHPVYAFENQALVSKQDQTLIRYADPDNTGTYEIRSGIREIAGQAFTNCRLSRVVIPDTVERIGWGAFDSSKNLKEVVIPEGVTEVGHQLFFYCPALESVSIPDSLTSIGSGIFADCDSLTSVNISPDHPVYEVRDHLFIDKNLKMIVSASAAISGKYEVPAGIQSIGDSAFQGCRKLTGVIIPEGVTHIGSSAFNACDQMKHITVPRSVYAIGSDAFSALDDEFVIRGYAGSYAQKYCEENGIRFEVIDDSAVEAQATDAPAAEVPVTDAPAGSSDGQKLYEYIAYGDSAAKITRVSTEIEIADIPAELDGHKVTSIGENAFDKCSKLKSVIIPEGVTSVEEDAFWYCSSLTDVTLPTSLLPPKKSPFNSCPKLENIHVSPHHPSPAFENHALINKQDQMLIRYADPANTGTYEIADGIRQIGNMAFDNSNLSAVVIPETVSGIAWVAFKQCKNLKEVVIPESVTQIENQVFYECNLLKSVSIPDTLTSIGRGVFSGCLNLTSIEISPDHPVYEVRDLALIEKREQNLVSLSGAVSGIYEVPAGIQNIGDLAFQGCIRLTEVIIPEGVKSIGSSAFNACRMLKEITVPRSVRDIGSDAFDTYNNATVIRGYAGSYVQKYCEENGIRFEVIDESAADAPAAETPVAQAPAAQSSAASSPIDSWIMTQVNETFPDISRELIPLHLTSENESARCELVAGLVKDQEAWIVLSLEDTTGKWLDQDTSRYVHLNSFIEGCNDTSNATYECTPNLEEHKVLRLHYFKFMDSAPDPDSSFIVGLSEPREGVSKDLFLSQSILQQAKVTEGVDLPANISDRKKTGPDAPDLPKKVLDYTRPRDFRLSNDLLAVNEILLTGIGWIDNQLHIQVHHTGKSKFRVDGDSYISWSAEMNVQVRGQEQDCAVIGWDDTGDAESDWLEFVWNITPEDYSIAKVEAVLKQLAAEDRAEWTFRVPVRSVLASSLTLKDIVGTWRRNQFIMDGEHGYALTPDNIEELSYPVIYQFNGDGTGTHTIDTYYYNLDWRLQGGKLFIRQYETQTSWAEFSLEFDNGTLLSTSESVDGDPIREYFVKQ